MVTLNVTLTSNGSKWVLQSKFKILESCLSPPLLPRLEAYGGFQIEYTKPSQAQGEHNMVYFMTLHLNVTFVRL